MFVTNVPMELSAMFWALPVVCLVLAEQFPTTIKLPAFLALPEHLVPMALPVNLAIMDTRVMKALVHALHVRSLGKQEPFPPVLNCVAEEFKQELFSV